MDLRFIVPKTNILNPERDHFLTEKIGDCWHEYDPDAAVKNMQLSGFVCKKCGNFFFTNNDFSSLEDFMKLLNWANEQTALSAIVAQFETNYFMDEEMGPQSRKRFADVLYALLSMTKRKKRNARRQRT
jgi:hypothetical protein